MLLFLYWSALIYECQIALMQIEALALISKINLKHFLARFYVSDLPLMFGPLFKLVNSSIYSLLYYPLALRPNPVV